MRFGGRLLLLRQLLALGLSPFARAPLNATLSESLAFLSACPEWHTCAKFMRFFFQSLAYLQSVLEFLSECIVYVTASLQRNSGRRVNNVDELNDIRCNGLPVSGQDLRQCLDRMKSQDIHGLVVCDLLNQGFVVPLRDAEFLVIDVYFFVRIALRSTREPYNMQDDQKQRLDVVIKSVLKDVMLWVTRQIARQFDRHVWHRALNMINI